MLKIIHKTNRTVGSLNFKSSVFEWSRKAIVDDDWDEVCREKTDIEIMHLDKSLSKEQTFSICDIGMNNCFESFFGGAPIFFNPKWKFLILQ